MSLGYQYTFNTGAIIAAASIGALDFVFTGTGGAVAGGEAALVIERNIAGSGGGVAGGVATVDTGETLDFIFDGTGGAVAGGVAMVTAEFVFMPSGGAVAGGAVVAGAIRTNRPTATIEFFSPVVFGQTSVFLHKPDLTPVAGSITPLKYKISRFQNRVGQWQCTLPADAIAGGVNARHLTDGFLETTDGPGGTFLETAQVFPQSGRMLLLGVVHMPWGGLDQPEATPSGVASSWSVVQSFIIDESGNHRFTLWRSNGSLSPGRVRIDFPLDSQSLGAANATYTLEEVAASDVVQSASASGFDDATGSVTLAAFQSATNSTFAIWQQSFDFPITFTPEAGWDTLMFREANDIIVGGIAMTTVITEDADIAPSIGLTLDTVWAGIALELVPLPVSEQIGANWRVSILQENNNPENLVGERYLLYQGIVEALDYDIREAGVAALELAGSMRTLGLVRRQLQTGYEFSGTLADLVDEVMQGETILGPDGSVIVPASASSANVALKFNDVTRYAAIVKGASIGRHAVRESWELDRLELTPYDGPPDPGIVLRLLNENEDRYTHANGASKVGLISGRPRASIDGSHVVNRVSSVGVDTIEDPDDHGSTITAELTLAHASLTSPYAVQTGQNSDGSLYYYLVDEESVSLMGGDPYGIIERRVVRTDIRNPNDDPASREQAANVLYLVTLHDLMINRSPLVSFAVGPLANGAHIWALPGDVCWVRFEGDVETETGEVRWLTLHKRFVVVERSDESHPSGVRQVSFKLGAPEIEFVVPGLPEKIDPETGLPVPDISLPPLPPLPDFGGLPGLPSFPGLPSLPGVSFPGLPGFEGLPYDPCCIDPTTEINEGPDLGDLFVDEGGTGEDDFDDSNFWSGMVSHGHTMGTLPQNRANRSIVMVATWGEPPTTRFSFSQMTLISTESVGNTRYIFSQPGDALGLWVSFFLVTGNNPTATLIGDPDASSIASSAYFVANTDIVNPVIEFDSQFEVIVTPDMDTVSASLTQPSTKQEVIHAQWWADPPTPFTGEVSLNVFLFGNGITTGQNPPETSLPERGDSALIQTGVASVAATYGPQPPTGVADKYITVFGFVLSMDP